ncbi:MAG: DNA-processing protein DprA, partial [Desulfobacterales bacterium]|nr:DNA-processing protein DprA [Desulfobacterales bacterium]
RYLMTKGNGRIDDLSVAIIGARNCTSYGEKIAYDMAYKLSQLNIQVISGLAYGIDDAAHKGAIDGGGCTLAVLGSGILNCYPKRHEKLYRLIQEKGLIVSEYGFYSKPLKHHFPFRNRLISALSEILIVIEAKEKSGTMITVNYGLDQGKTIMAVPGPIDSELSKGTHALLKQGALLCTCVDDIIFELKNLII